MSLLTVVRQVCSVVGVIRPQAVFAQINTNRTMQEMVDCANEMAQRIAYDNRDWTVLLRKGVFTGATLPPGIDPGDEALHAMPPDYKRMLLSSNVWRSTSTMQPMRFIPDPDEWMRRRNAHQFDGRGEWTMARGFMHISPPLRGLIAATPGPPATAEVPAETVNFMYVEKNCIALNSGGFGNEFMNDADTYRLDERLLKLAMISEWKMKKGSPYAEDLSTYNDALAMVQGHDGPAPIIIGNMPISAGARVAYPWPSSWGPQR